MAKRKRLKRMIIGIVAFVVVAGAAAGYYVYYNFIDPPSRFADSIDKQFNGDVIVVGAGASGLTAAYVLEREGANVTVIEAADVYGGRMREAENFADFPIDLGAEWIHEDPSILSEIVADESVDVSVETITYNPRDIYEYSASDGLTKDTSIASRLYSEYKFKDTTWFSFFENYIVPSVRDKIILSRPVGGIDYSGDGKITISTVDPTTFEPAETYTADRVLVTVPITVLQNRWIDFEPDLSDAKRDAIDSITVPDGLKVFFEFDDKFYPDMLSFSDYSRGDGTEEKLYYDAAFGKDTDRNILGLLAIGSGAKELVGLDDDAIKDTILAELDAIYGGRASASYKQHIVQNWTSEPFIHGAYSTEFREAYDATVDTIAQPIDNRVYFSGEALSKERQSTVPGAAESGFDAAKRMLEDPVL